MVGDEGIGEPCLLRQPGVLDDIVGKMLFAGNGVSDLDVGHDRTPRSVFGVYSTPSAPRGPGVRDTREESGFRASRVSRPWHEHPQHPDFAAVLGLVLHQVVQHVCGSDGVIGEIALAMELGG